MTVKSILASVLIFILLCPSLAQGFYPPDIQVEFLGWRPDGGRCAFRKTVTSTGDRTLNEESLYIVDIADNGLQIEILNEFDKDTIAALGLIATQPVENNDEGSPDITFLIQPGRYVYFDYHTVVDDVGHGGWDYTIHRRIWMLDKNGHGMIYKDDEKHRRSSLREERAIEAYLSPRATRLFVVFKVTSHYGMKGFSIIDLANAKVIDQRIHELN